MKDKNLTCDDCGMEFVFSAGEQGFYSARNLAEPEYCLICRGKYEAQARQFGKFGRKAEDDPRK